MAEVLRVLVVDDEPGMRTGVARALRSYKVLFDQLNGEVTYEITDASTGEECLEICQKADQRPDILLLDYKLPGISGLEILDRVVKYRPEMLTIVITAYASLETAITATRKGAYDFLAKPFTPDELRHTVRKTSERLLLERKAKKLAEEKRQLRFEIISMVAHELKAPLAAIEGYLRIVLEKAAGDDPKVYQQMLERSLIRSQGMRKIILDLLDLTRIESGQVKRELMDIDVVESARTSIETLGPEAKNMNVNVSLHAGENCRMIADRGELDIIFNNLVSNAIKYNREGGTVDISVKKEDGHIVISSTDTGIGLAEEDIAMLFREFTRIKNEKTRNILGSGLGLSIVKKLVEFYHGKIEVNSKPGQGTTFTITLGSGK
ncbi:MAG: ATP-binding protein [Phycisphaerae bacterium]